MTCFKCRNRHARNWDVPEHSYYPITMLPVDQRQAMDAAFAALKCTSCTGEKVGAKELRRRKRAAFEAAKLQRERPEVVLELEVMFHALAAEMALWADAPAVDRHGDPDGNNPHVWFALHEGDVDPVAFAADIALRGDEEFVQWRDVNGVARRCYPERFDTCTCGVRKFVVEPDPAGYTMMLYLNGLWQRDVH